MHRRLGLAERHGGPWRAMEGHGGPWRAMEGNGGLQGSNNKCLWPECLVEAAAGHFRHLTAGKRQA